MSQRRGSLTRSLAWEMSVLTAPEVSGTLTAPYLGGVTRVECPACGLEALPRLVGQADNLRAQRHIVKVGSVCEGANEPGQKAFLTREADGAPSRTGAGLNGRS